MVDIVFLVEGESEEVLIDHLKEIKWFEQFNLNIKLIINVGGNGNFCSHNIGKFVSQAKMLKPDKIIIFTDLECDNCIEQTKERLGTCNDCTVVVSRKALESWFLSDTALMIKITNNSDFYYELPESTIDMPIDTIKLVLAQNNVRGTGPSKPRFIKRMIRDGFDIQRASQHQNSNSINYFIEKIKTIGEDHNE
jgi:hypothetical protein